MFGVRFFLRLGCCLDAPRLAAFRPQGGSNNLQPIKKLAPVV
jgi:hypothetical protein